MSSPTSPAKLKRRPVARQAILLFRGDEKTTFYDTPSDNVYKEFHSGGYTLWGRKIVHVVDLQYHQPTTSTGELYIVFKSAGLPAIEIMSAIRGLTKIISNPHKKKWTWIISVFRYAN